MLTTFEPITPIEQDEATISRSASIVGERPLVLFQKDGKALSPDCRHDWPALLSMLDCGPVLELERNDWPWSNECAVNFNCHAMAIGSGIGVTPADWLEGIASPATLGENPTDLILKSYFQLLRISSPTADKEEGDLLQDDDVFVLRNTTDAHYIHSGFVKFIDGDLIAISKFGEGPILLTSVELIKKFYWGKYDEIRWYRFAGE